MNGPGEGRRRTFLLLMPLLLGSIAIPAARSDAAETKPTAAQVADGLKAVQHAAEEVAEYAGTDKAKAQRYWDEAHEAWESIEDTIRDNDKDAYVAFEDALEGLGTAAKNGDAKEAAEEAEALTKTTEAYLAKFPGDASAAAPAPAPEPAPAASQTPAPAASDTPTPDAAPAPAPARAADTATRAPAAAAAAPAPAAAPASEPAPEATLARTGSGASTLAALAGIAFVLGGLAVIGSARRRISLVG